ncbi:hypothetical protein KIN20_024434 [Parelaphostrongylus tenuis]|uniref:Uncharacterized protein n=1 Tax=Parelaphostrongylus tenuis TaxID=148309 RepID=A0AAD5MTI0_PARTN|nr:hypothetical protein KIN20_024434 [Parelaphostrongylus tenuis]
MWAQKILVALLIGYAIASKVFQEAKVGDRVVLDLGRDVVTWKRVRDNNKEEYIKYCGSGKTEPRCKGFVTKNGQPATPASKAHVEKDGKLVFDPFMATDAGLYSSPDQKPKERKQGGAVSAVLNTHIALIVKE